MNPLAARRSPLASLIESRAMCAWTCGAAALHIGLELAGLGGWPCPMLHATGIPCPGCGLGRAAALLLRGEWRAAWVLHAFAPLLLTVLAACAACAFMPDPPRHRFVALVSRLEERTACSAIALAGLLIYWLLRLTLDGSR